MRLFMASADPAPSTSEAFRNRNYLADDGVPDCVTLCPGTGLDLKAEAARRTDRHGVFRADDLAHVSVESRHRDKAVPIYIIPELIGHTIEMVVSGYGAPIWVKPTSDTDAMHAAARSSGTRAGRRHVSATTTAGSREPTWTARR